MDYYTFNNREVTMNLELHLVVTRCVRNAYAVRNLKSGIWRSSRDP